MQIWRSMGLVITLVLLWTGGLCSQDKMEVIQRLDELQKQLSAQQITDRDAAEAEIVKLGPIALDYLETPDDATTDFRERVARIRTQLEKVAVEAVSESSQATLQGTMTVQDALNALEKQTGNVVTVAADQFGETEIDLDLKESIQSRRSH